MKIEDGKARYLEIWSAIFKEFRGWTAEQTWQWALRQEHFGAGEIRDFWTLHDPVARPVAWELLPNDLIQGVKERSIGLMLDLESEAESALWPGQYELEGRDPSRVNWVSIRGNFENVIARYENLLQKSM